MSGIDYSRWLSTPSHWPSHLRPFALLAVLPFSSKESKKRHVSYRKFRIINLDLFQSDLKQTVSTINLESDLTALLDTYNCKLTELMDNHTNRVMDSTKTDYFNNKVIVNKYDQKSLFEVFDQITRKPTSVPPSSC